MGADRNTNIVTGQLRASKHFWSSVTLLVPFKPLMTTWDAPTVVVALTIWGVDRLWWVYKKLSSDSILCYQGQLADLIVVLILIVLVIRFLPVSLCVLGGRGRSRGRSLDNLTTRCGLNHSDSNGALGARSQTR